jgi:hypothetical protein
MAWLEIIEIRAVGSKRELLESQLQDLINVVNQDTNLQTIKVYMHVILETDFSIHLFHDSQKVDTSCSSICTRLVSSLNDFGLVNHTVWVENSNRGDRNETKK